ncbi:hypothetical protein ACVIQY_002687 [Bradyrhizobium sp. USDA 3051]
MTPNPTAAKGPMNSPCSAQSAIEIRLTESFAPAVLAEARQRFQEQLGEGREVARETEALQQEREKLKRED